ncbi:zinc/manganese transporter permease [Sulfurifustis variabilis]|uniref:Zinc/manganese transporter permease n=1 Tax=Sulfurifustis variabilis TaxID=1675686 RepID=A0A1B4V8M3_9GAMM|nr:metal ABC transporter permease [Sulfurifustis variabilis]BAU48992.1 zinc/manganese transporter permease [Sulfurifustis variabilis]
MSTEALDPVILVPALLAGLLVLATHVPLGRQVLARGIIFIDLAVAQVAGLGVIAAYALDMQPGAFGVQLAAVVAALAAAALLRYAESRWPEILEALIGGLFVVAASIAVLLLAGNPHGGEHLRDLLTGQILWVSPSALVVAAAVYAVVLAAWFGLRARQGGTAFYVLFAVTVTVSVQLVGVYLVFASLILPALAVRRLGTGAGLVCGYAIGGIGYALGIVLSALLDLPTGAVVVCTLALVAGLGGFIRARAGRAPDGEAA